MAEVASGIRSILSLSAVYNTFDRLTGAARSRDEIARRYLRLSGGERVLDIGCGTALIFDHLPEVTYVGFDPSERYIESARERLGDRAELCTGTVNAATFGPDERFDVVMALGVVHHLDDDEAARLFALAGELLASSGRLVTVDACFLDSQSRASRFLVSRDRGQNVRTLDGYLELARQSFSVIETDTRSNLLRIPYTHAILECTKG